MTTTTNVEQVKLNIMTSSQFESATKNADELYMVTDANYSLTAGDGIDITNDVISVDNTIALDADVVHKTGTETITGAKTFTTSANLYIPKLSKQDSNLEGGQINFEKANNSDLLENPFIDLYKNSIRIIGIDSQNENHCVFEADIENNAVFVTTANTSSNDTTAASTAFVHNMLAAMYPVGAIYIGTMSTCPLAAFFGTWTKIGDGRVLQNSDTNHTAGTTIEAGLPNITGSLRIGDIQGVSYPYAITLATGAFYATSSGSVANVGGNSVTGKNQTASFDASHSNSIYGKSTTVQPPAFVVNIWQRTA